MPVHQLQVDLSLPPQQRWHIPDHLVDAAASLLDFYLKDLGDLGDLSELLMDQAPAFIPSDYLQELEGLTERFSIPYKNLLTTNLYFDLLKFVLGCSAFVINTPEGPMHARNLDWWSENHALKKLSTVTHFIHGPQGDFYSFGWPGFNGILSAMAPGRFSITVNAVLSDEPARPATPLVYLLRDIFENCSHYEQAKEQLARTEIASDALILLSGSQYDEACVIERTPSHSAIRDIEDDWIAVTNSYQLIDADTPEISELQSSSCGRYQHLEKVLSKGELHNHQSCLKLLNAPQVIMNMTMQHMVFQASTGYFEMTLPADQ